MKYVLSGRVVHVVRESETITLCGKFVWNFEHVSDRNDSPDLLCKRCEKSTNKNKPPKP